MTTLSSAPFGAMSGMTAEVPLKVDTAAPVKILGGRRKSRKSRKSRKTAGGKSRRSRRSRKHRR